MTDIHGWHPADEPPPVDSEGESDYVLVLTEGGSVPVVAYYIDSAHGSERERWSSSSMMGPVHARWWKPLDKIPVSLFPPARARWVIETGLAFDDTKGEGK